MGDSAMSMMSGPHGDSGPAHAVSLPPGFLPGSTVSPAAGTDLRTNPDSKSSQLGLRESAQPSGGHPPAARGEHWGREPGKAEAGGPPRPALCDATTPRARREAQTRHMECRVAMPLRRKLAKPSRKP